MRQQGQRGLTLQRCLEIPNRARKYEHGLLIMRKIEIVSLVLVVAAVGVLMIAIQMDYGNYRTWMFILFVALFVLSIDPSRPLKMMRQQPKKVEEPAEEVEPNSIWLEFAVPVASVDKKWLEGQDVYLRFHEGEFTDYDYYIHYHNGMADETYVGGWHDMESLDYDEVFEDYQTLASLLASAENGEIEDLCIISSEEFGGIKHIYENLQITQAQHDYPRQDQPEPVNRVGKMVAYLIALFSIVGICMAIYTLVFATST